MAKQLDSEIVLLAVAYMVSGVLAFGHCNVNTKFQKEQKGIACLGALLFSPLYWSSCLFEQQKEQK